MNAERNAEILALGRQVVAHMEPGWSAGTVDEWFGAGLHGPDNALVWLSKPSSKPGYVHASGNFPETRKTLRTRPSVNVRADRGPAVIAREITRRLLPAYLPLLAEVVEYNATEDYERSSRKTVVDKFGALFPGSHSSDIGYTGYGRRGVLGGAGGIGTVEATGDGSNVTLNVRVPADVAMQILELVAESRQREGQR